MSFKDHHKKLKKMMTDYNFAVGRYYFCSMEYDYSLEKENQRSRFIFLCHLAIQENFKHPQCSYIIDIGLLCFFSCLCDFVKDKISLRLSILQTIFPKKVKENKKKACYIS